MLNWWWIFGILLLRRPLGGSAGSDGGPEAAQLRTDLVAARRELRAGLRLRSRRPGRMRRRLVRELGAIRRQVAASALRCAFEFALVSFYRGELPVSCLRVASSSARLESRVFIARRWTASFCVESQRQVGFVLLKLLGLGAVFLGRLFLQLARDGPLPRRCPGDDALLVRHEILHCAAEAAGCACCADVALICRAATCRAARCPRPLSAAATACVRAAVICCFARERHWLGSARRASAGRAAVVSRAICDGLSGTWAPPPQVDRGDGVVELVRS